MQTDTAQLLLADQVSLFILGRCAFPGAGFQLKSDKRTCVSYVWRWRVATPPACSFPKYSDLSIFVPLP